MILWSVERADHVGSMVPCLLLYISPAARIFWKESNADWLTIYSFFLIIKGDIWLIITLHKPLIADRESMWNFHIIFHFHHTYNWLIIKLFMDIFRPFLVRMRETLSAPGRSSAFNTIYTVCHKPKYFCWLNLNVAALRMKPWSVVSKNVIHTECVVRHSSEKCQGITLLFIRT